MKILATIVRTPAADLLLVAEALLFLGVARAALRAIPLSTLVRWLRRPGRHSISPRKDAADSEYAALRIRWAILAVERRMPGFFVCFPQCLAAYAMLRRRGFPSVLLYGVNRSPDNQLRAHTWLKLGELTVVGGESAAEFTVVSTFP